MPFLRLALLALVVVIATVAPCRVASAHKDDYIDETFVYQTLEAGELELEVWGDVRDAPLSGLYTGSVEVGILDRWMADAAVQVAHTASGVSFDRVRAESRVRFSDEGALPIDVSASVEYEVEAEAEGDVVHTLTPRLILSKDPIPALNVTLNLDLPVTLAPSGFVDFAWAVGLRWNATEWLRPGVEGRHFARAGHAVVFPQLSFVLPGEVSIKLGLGVGLGEGVPRLDGRLVVEVEL